MNNFDKWVEDFYSELERTLTKYKRPADYKERAARLLARKSKPCRESIK